MASGGEAERAAEVTVLDRPPGSSERLSSVVAVMDEQFCDDERLEILGAAAGPQWRPVRPGAGQQDARRRGEAGEAFVLLEQGVGGGRGQDVLFRSSSASRTAGSGLTPLDG